MKENKKRMIDYLDINEDFYIENDKLKTKLCENEMPQRCSWEKVRLTVKEIMEKIFEYEHTHFKD